MARFLFSSDWHAHNFEQFSTRLANGLNSRFQIVLDAVAYFRTCCEHYKIDHAFILGDIFHSRRKLDIDVVAKMTEALRDITDHSALTILVGNHDCWTKGNEIHSLEIFKDFARVVEKPEVLNYHGCSFLAVPYNPDVVALANTVNAAATDFLLLHQGVMEAALGPIDIRGIAELSLNDLNLDNYRYVVAGDYHKRQWLAGGRFHYTGSPYQQSMSERGEAKMFSLIDTSDWVWHEIPTQAPHFHLFNNVDEYNGAIAEDKVNLEQDFVRVHTIDPAEERRILEHNPRAQVILEKQRMVQNRERIDSSAAASDLLLLQKYMQLVPPQLNGCSTFDVLSTGIQYLMEDQDGECEITEVHQP